MVVEGKESRKKMKIGKRDRRGFSFFRANIIRLTHIWPCWILLGENQFGTNGHIQGRADTPNEPGSEGIIQICIKLYGKLDDILQGNETIIYLPPAKTEIIFISTGQKSKLTECLGCNPRQTAKSNLDSFFQIRK